MALPASLNVGYQSAHTRASISGDWGSLLGGKFSGEWGACQMKSFA